MANFHDFDFEVKAVRDTGVFEGYGSCFNNIDGHGEIVATGAFTQSLQNHRQKGTMPAMLWQHQQDNPVGVFTAMAEDSKGLHVVGQLAMQTVKGAETFQFLKIRAVTGLSVGFCTKAETRDKKTGTRIINEVDLHEVSIVTFPANSEARIQTVKSISTIRDAESYLRDAGMSRVESATFLSRIKSLNQSQRDADNESDNKLKALFAALKNRCIFA